MGSVPPTRDAHLAVLGCGFMGTALLGGILTATQGTESPISKYSACVKSESSIERLRTALASHQDRVDFVCDDNVRAADAAQIVILAFPPQELHRALGAPGMSEALKGKLIISIVAGKSCHDIQNVLKASRKSAASTEEDAYDRITRVIPSIGAQINESMSLMAETPLSASDRELVLGLFRQVGKVQLLPEALLNAATAVSAACHALTATAVDAIVDGSVSMGVPRSTALAIASQCLRSSSSLLLDGMTIEGFKESMSVPEGITINAILQLERGHARSAISDAVREAITYADRM